MELEWKKAGFNSDEMNRWMNGGFNLSEQLIPAVAKAAAILGCSRYSGAAAVIFLRFGG